MITADGERSLKRLPQAKKALALIEMLDLPAKASITEGFRYRVWQLDGGELSGGRVVAPLGALVLYSSGTAIRQFVLDSLETVAAEIGKGCGALDTGCTLDTLEGRGLLAVSPLPATFDDTILRYDSAASATAGAYAMPLYTYPTFKAAQPVATPRGGESCYVDHVSHVAGGLGGAITSLLVSANLRETHCYSSGRTLSPAPSDRQSGFYLDVLSNVNAGLLPQINVMTCLSQQPGYWERVCVLPGPNGFKFVAGDLNNVFMVYTGYTAATKSYILGYLTIGSVLATAPSSVRSALAPQWPTHLYGAYIRTASDVKGIAVLENPALGGYRCPLLPPPGSNCVPDADQVWQITLSFVSLNTGLTVKTANDFYTFMNGVFLSSEFDWAFPDRQAILDAYNAVDPPLPANLKVPYHTIFGFILGWPNAVMVALRRDTVTFPDASGDFYSWVRDTAPNGFRFSPSLAAGIERKTVNVPAQVLSDATLRPCIFLAAAGVYYCVADNAAGEIKGLHVGSPFAAWEQVILPTGVTMYSVRGVVIAGTAAASAFIGVGKTVTPAAGMTPEISTYRVYFKPVGGEWVGISTLPVQAVDDAVASWDVCVFGDDPLAQSMQSLVQQPVARGPMAPVFR